MKRAKKGLAAILSTCMLLSLLPVAAFAEGAPAADTLEEAAQPTTVEKTLAEMFADAQDGETLGQGLRPHGYLFRAGCHLRCRLVDLRQGIA